MSPDTESDQVESNHYTRPQRVETEPIGRPKDIKPIVPSSRAVPLTVPCAVVSMVVVVHSYAYIAYTSFNPIEPKTRVFLCC